MPTGLVTVNSFNSVQAKGSTYMKHKNPLQAVIGWERFEGCADGLHLRQNGTEEKRGHLLSRTTMVVAYLIKKSHHEKRE